MTEVQQTQRTSGVGVAVIALCLVQFVDVLGVTVVVTALPDMLASLHTPGSYASLVGNGSKETGVDEVRPATALRC
jgi:hypothetical protein